MKPNKITVACVLRTPPEDKPGKQKVYGNIDVVRLKKGVDNFLKIDHDFVCLTDRTDIEVPTIPLIGNTPAWWAKLELFRPKLFKNPVLYIDLDMVICGNLDEMVQQFFGNPFMLLGDSRKGVMGSGMIYFEGTHSDLWGIYISDPKGYQKKYAKKPRYGDQAFIEDHKSFKAMNETVNPNWFQKLTFDTIPHPDSKILICVGKGNKLHRPEYQRHGWVNTYWRFV